MCAEVRMDFTAFLFSFIMFTEHHGGVGLKCAELGCWLITKRFLFFRQAQMKTKCWCCFVWLAELLQCCSFHIFNELLSHFCTLSIDFHASNLPPYWHLSRQFYITVHHFSHIKSLRSHSSHLLPYFPVGPQHHLVYLILFSHCKTTIAYHPFVSTHQFKITHFPAARAFTFTWNFIYSILSFASILVICIFPSCLSFCSLTLSRLAAHILSLLWTKILKTIHSPYILQLILLNSIYST